MHSSVRHTLVPRRIHDLQRSANRERLHASPPGARHTQPRLAISVLLTIALAAAIVGAIASAAAAHTLQATTGTAHRALCQITLPVRLRPARTAHAATRRFDSSNGTGSCTGTLGPWLMAGRRGSTTAAGAFELIRNRAGRMQIAGGDGRLWGWLPRFAWWHPPIVTFTSRIHLYHADHVLRIAGHGRLTPTAQAPLHGRFTIAGTADIRHERTQSRTKRILTLHLSVVSERSS